MDEGGEEVELIWNFSGNMYQYLRRYLYLDLERRKEERGDKLEEVIADSWTEKRQAAIVQHIEWDLLRSQPLQNDTAREPLGW